ncbi:hypothetical protein FOA52_002085 [Chlamydomonas sp. UWO 241]|nr:hypothetical protein FOA52_002085 [Chlamydomonas sp. UWO 241]
MAVSWGYTAQLCAWLGWLLMLLYAPTLHARRRDLACSVVRLLPKAVVLLQYLLRGKAAGEADHPSIFYLGNRPRVMLFLAGKSLVFWQVPSSPLCYLKSAGDALLSWCVLRQLASFGMPVACGWSVLTEMLAASMVLPLSTLLAMRSFTWVRRADAGPRTRSGDGVCGNGSALAAVSQSAHAAAEQAIETEAVAGAPLRKLVPQAAVADEADEAEEARLLALARKMVAMYDAAPPPVYVSQYAPTERICIKVRDLEPDSLLPDWRETLRVLLAEHGMVAKSMHVRRGCTQITMQVKAISSLLPSSDHRRLSNVDAQALAESLRVWLPQLFSAEGSARATLQVGSSHVLSLPMSPSDGDGPCPDPTAASQLPPHCTRVDPCVISFGGHSSGRESGGSSRKVVVSLSSPLPPGCRLIARAPDGTLSAHVCTEGSGVDGVAEVTVDLEAPSHCGLIELEVLNMESGLLGSPTSVLAVPGEDAARELRSLCDGMPGRHPLLADLAHWLSDATRHAREREAAAVANPFLALRQQSDPAASARTAARSMLEFLILMGRGAAAACILDALVDAYALSPGALLHGCGPACVWSSPPGSSGSGISNSGSGSNGTTAPQLSLLHHVAAFGNPDAARVLIAWAERRGVAPDWDIPAATGSVTPAHVAAAARDGGAIAALVVESRTRKSVAAGPSEIAAGLQHRALGGAGATQQQRGQRARSPHRRTSSSGDAPPHASSLCNLTPRASLNNTLRALEARALSAPLPPSVGASVGAADVEVEAYRSGLYFLQLVAMVPGIVVFCLKYRVDFANPWVFCILWLLTVRLVVSAARWVRAHSVPHRALVALAALQFILRRLTYAYTIVSALTGAAPALPTRACHSAMTRLTSVPVECMLMVTEGAMLPFVAGQKAFDLILMYAYHRAISLPLASVHTAVVVAFSWGGWLWAEAALKRRAVEVVARTHNRSGKTT